MSRATSRAPSSRSPTPRSTASTSATILSDHPIAARWREVRGEGRAALIPYLTAGLSTPRGRGVRPPPHRLPGRGRSYPRARGGGESGRADPAHRAHHDGRAARGRGAGRERLHLPHLPPRRHRSARPHPARSRRAGGARPGRHCAPHRRGLRHQHRGAGARRRPSGGRCGGGQRPGGHARHGGAGRGGAVAARVRAGRAGARPLTPDRMITLYSRALLYRGPGPPPALLVADRRWMSQPLEVLFLTACCVGLRGAPIPLSKYSYLTQTGLVALTGSLLVGLPATALAVAAGTLCADWAWQRKTPSAAVINAGREVVALVAAFGVYAALVAALGLAASGLRVELLLPLFAYAIAYFALSRILFYFSLIL